MIRITLVTRHPILAKEITVGHIDIANDQSGTEAVSSHGIEVYRRAKDKPLPEHFRSGRLENFARGELSYLDLLHQSLNAVAEDGFRDTAKLQQRLQVTIHVTPEGAAGKPETEGRLHIERQKGGSDTSAKYKIDLFAIDSADRQLKVFRSCQLRNFDVTNNGYFDLLRASLNASIKDGFFTRTQGAG